MQKTVLYFYFLSISIFLSLNIYGQVYVAKSILNSDATTSLQSAFNNPQIRTVVVNAGDITVNGTVTIPPGKELKVEAGFKLTGKGTINGGNINADYQRQIFDTSLTVNPASVNQYFSVKWFGAKGNNTDDYTAIQKTINTCIKNNIRTVYLPAGRYKISKPLILRGSSLSNNDNDAQRSFCTVELLGESSFWDSNTGSDIIATFSNSFAIGIQTGKGCKIRKLSIAGLFTPPKLSDLHKFFSLSFDEFKDSICRDSRYSPYAAIVIDPFTNKITDKLPPDGGYPGLTNYYGHTAKLGSTYGSTGTELEELSINGFVTGICSSPNGITRNAEITIINKIHFKNCKLCISGGQDQEKGNVVTNIYCWGVTHTIFATGLYGSPRMAGNWNIDHVNVAGAVVRLVFNDQHGYFPTYISHVFAESLGSFGTLNSELACEVSDCIFDFAYPKDAGQLTVLTSWGENVLFRSCSFRYYGGTTPLQIEGNCVFDHCYFSGALNRSKAGSLFNLVDTKLPKDGNYFLFGFACILLITSLITLIYFSKNMAFKKYFIVPSNDSYLLKEVN